MYIGLAPVPSALGVNEPICTDENVETRLRRLRFFFRAGSGGTPKFNGGNITKVLVFRPNTDILFKTTSQRSISPLTIRLLR